MSAGPAFPNYMQMRPRVPVRAWHAIRLGSVSATLALCACLVVAPDAGFFVFWGLVIPLLPLVFFLAPGCGGTSARSPP